MSLLDVIRKSKTTPLSDVLRNDECKHLWEKVKEVYGESMTGLIVIVELKNKESYYHSAGNEALQLIASLDQAHHRAQHEGLPPGP